LRQTTIGRVEYAVFSPNGNRRAPLAIPTAEPGLRAALESIGPAPLECETFPQVAQAVESGHFRGVLPVFARHGLQRPVTVERLPALDAVATNLVIAWRSRLDEVRPDIAKFRTLLVAALRRQTE
jgi:DNA-binding transcriptional LysR family regulator